MDFVMVIKASGFARGGVYMTVAAMMESSKMAAIL